MAMKGVAIQFVDTFRRLSKLQKASILAASVAVFATVVTLLLWANKPVYKTLYADLPEESVKEITEALDGKKAVYKLINGATIEVPADSVYATRMTLALEGLPNEQAAGFELFDDNKLGMTEFSQNINYQRALQGELARSITAINEVVEAKVHLSIPKDRIFMDDEEDGAKASVVVRLLPGVKLRQDQVKAIAHLVAAAVRELIPQKVQVIDTEGNLLSEFLTSDNTELYATQSQLDQQRNQEKVMEKKLQGLLGAVIGTGRYVARTSIEMDFNKRDVLREEYSDTPVLRSQYSQEINQKSTGKGPQGIPGVESNLAEPDQFVDNIMTEYSKSEETQNFEISKTVIQEQKTNGEIKRITVSVIVDDRPEQVNANGVLSIVKQPRTQDELDKIRTAVASAVGFNESRGDVVDVTNISFDTSDEWVETVTAEKEKTMEWISMAAKYGSAVVILLLFYILLIRPILKRIDTARDFDDEMSGETALDAQIAGLDAVTTIGDESGFPKSVDELEREIESELDESVPLDVDAVKSKVMLKKIEETAQEDPELIANLVKAMLKGGG